MAQGTAEIPLHPHCFHISCLSCPLSHIAGFKDMGGTRRLSCARNLIDYLKIGTDFPRISRLWIFRFRVLICIGKFFILVLTWLVLLGENSERSLHSSFRSCVIFSQTAFVLFFFKSRKCSTQICWRIFLSSSPHFTLQPDISGTFGRDEIAVPDFTANPLELGGEKGRNGPAKGELTVHVKVWPAELNQP